jgi:SAM-dependent methyltransferase
VYEGEALRVLHVSPDCLRVGLETLASIDYVAGDLHPTGVDVRLDLTDIALPDESFDAVLCSHVLEHVPDDRRAMAEIRRVLRAGGWALINVPSDPERTTTFEDPQIVAPGDRLQQFGQADHVRVYNSAEFADRLRRTGFDVDVDPVQFTAAERLRYRLDGDGGWDHSYFCRKTAHPSTGDVERRGRRGFGDDKNL